MASEATLARRQADRRPTFETPVEEIHPAFGWALVREIDLGQTAAGLVLPSVMVPSPDGKPHMIANHAAKHHELIETSRGCSRVGLFCESDLKPGDRVVLCSGATRASMAHFPRGVFLIMLEQVIGYERERAS